MLWNIDVRLVKAMDFNFQLSALINH